SLVGRSRLTSTDSSVGSSTVPETRRSVSIISTRPRTISPSPLAGRSLLRILRSRHSYIHVQQDGERGNAKVRRSASKDTSSNFAIPLSPTPLPRGERGLN